MVAVYQYMRLLGYPAEKVWAGAPCAAFAEVSFQVFCRGLQRAGNGVSTMVVVTDASVVHELISGRYVIHSVRTVFVNCL